MLRIGFRVGGERYALPGRRVVEVIPRVTLRRVPLAPPEIPGLFTYRGTVTPVVDLTRLLAGEPCPDRLSSRIVVVELSAGAAGQRRLVGLLAEAVTEVLTDDDVPQPALALGDAPFLGGVVHDGGELVQLIDPERLLSGALLEVLEPPAEAGP